MSGVFVAEASFSKRLRDAGTPGSTSITAARFLIPPDLFRSRYAPGRFTDAAQEAGVNRFAQGGAAVCDDFDGDGQLDFIAASLRQRIFAFILLR